MTGNVDLPHPGSYLVDEMRRITPEWYGIFADLASGSSVISSAGSIEVTGTYTVTTADDGKIINLTGSSSFTLSYGAQGGYFATHSNFIVNRTTRVVTLAVNGLANRKLWPGQKAWVLGFSGTWYASPQERYLSSSVILYCHPQGSDTANDGLASGSTGAFRNPQKAVNVALYEIDSAGGVPAISLADNLALGSGFEYDPFTVISDGLGTNQVAISGNALAPQNVIISRTSAGELVYAKDKGIVTIENLTLRPDVAGCTCLSAGHLGVIDFAGIIFQAAPSGNHITAIGTGTNINCIGDYYIQGGAVSHMNAQRGANIFAGNAADTVTIGGTPTFTYFALAIDRAGVQADGPITYSGAVNAATQKYLANTGGGITQNGTTFPGGVAGVADAATYGWAV